MDQFLRWSTVELPDTTNLKLKVYYKISKKDIKDLKLFEYFVNFLFVILIGNVLMEEQLFLGMMNFVTFYVWKGCFQLETSNMCLL